MPLSAQDRYDAGYFSSIIVIAEGAKPVDGPESVVGERKAGEMLRYSGAADRLAKMLSAANKEVSWGASAAGV